MVIEVNSAWGVHWYLDEINSRMLTQVQFQYDPNKPIRLSTRSKSVSPSTLAQFMSCKGFNIQDIGTRLHYSFQSYFTDMTSLTSNYRDLSRFDRMGSRLEFSNPNDPSFGVAFELGSVYGDKSIIIDDKCNNHELYKQVHAYDSLQSLGL